ncbi:MAG: aldose 1-epimerase family protein [Planctomycetales bacterium]|nr:aldose 1-epimerase family protein [Planctomycetales bacterium]
MRIDLPELQRISTPPDLATPLRQPASVDAAGGQFQIARLQLTDGPSQHVELLLVDTGRVRAAICPTRGMSLWKANIDGDNLGWKSPVEGPVHPNWVPISEPSGLGWLDGFDELLVRCGLRSFGAPDFGPTGALTFPLHGRIANLPARSVQIEVDQAHSLLHVTGEVHETRFLQTNLRLDVRYTFALDDPKIAIHDTVTNAGAGPADMQLLYHINIGAPHLQQGSTLHLNADKIVARNAHAAKDLAEWSTYLAPTAGYAEQVYFSASRADASGWTKCLLASRAGKRGVAVHYRPETLPFFSQWKNTVAEADGYVTGLEPATGFPNPRSFEEAHGRLVQLQAGESREFVLTIEGIASAERIAAVKREITSAGTAPSTSAFDADWCVAES